MKGRNAYEIVQKPEVLNYSRQIRSDGKPVGKRVAAKQLGIGVGERDKRNPSTQLPVPDPNSAHEAHKVPSTRLCVHCGIRHAGSASRSNKGARNSGKTHPRGGSTLWKIVTSGLV